VRELGGEDGVGFCDATRAIPVTGVACHVFRIRDLGPSGFGPDAFACTALNNHNSLAFCPLPLPGARQGACQPGVWFEPERVSLLLTGTYENFARFGGIQLSVGKFGGPGINYRVMSFLSNPNILWSV